MSIHSNYSSTLINKKVPSHAESTDSKPSIAEAISTLSQHAIADATSKGASSDKKFIICDQTKRISSSTALAHLTLNNLTHSAKYEIKHLLSQFGKLIDKYALDTEDLDFLLKATPDARCIMVPKWTEDATKRTSIIWEFKEMLLQAKDGIYPADFETNARTYAENLEAFATAIGYSALNPDKSTLGPSWVEKDGTASESLKTMIKHIAEGPYIVSSVGETAEWAHAFPKRANESIPIDMQDVVAGTDEVIQDDPKSIQKPLDSTSIYIIESYEQEHIDNREVTRKGLDPRAFTHDSYVARGLRDGVAMRAHVSGSAPLTLAALRFFDGSDARETSEDQLFLRAGFITAIYQLGDYHTIAETAAGISHYHQRESYTQKKDDRIYTSENSLGAATTNYLEEISPVIFQNMGIGHMAKITHEEMQDAFTLASQKLLEEIPSRQSQAPKIREEGPANLSATSPPPTKITSTSKKLTKKWLHGNLFANLKIPAYNIGLPKIALGA